MKTITTLFLSGLLATACSDGGSGDGPKGPHADRYEKVLKATASAQKSIDFIKIKTDCGLIESKDPGVAKDPQHVKLCRVAPLAARAKLVISESKPGAPSNGCMFVTSDIEGAIKDKIEADQMKKLLTAVNQACGG